MQKLNSIDFHHLKQNNIYIYVIVYVSTKIVRAMIFNKTKRCIQKILTQEITMDIRLIYSTILGIIVHFRSCFWQSTNNDYFQFNYVLDKELLVLVNNN